MVWSLSSCMDVDLPIPNLVLEHLQLEWGGSPALLFVALATIHLVLVICTDTTVVIECLCRSIIGVCGDFLRGLQSKKLVLLYFRVCFQVILFVFQFKMFFGCCGCIFFYFE